MELIKYALVVEWSPLANVVGLTQVLIDTCCTQLSLVNCRVTGWKPSKFMSDIDG